MQNNIERQTMTKEKRQTLNADKRKVIADVFQSHFEDNSKFQILIKIKSRANQQFWRSTIK